MQPEILYSIIGFMTGLIVLLIGTIWHINVGATKRLFAVLDDMRETMMSIEKSLRTDLSMLDRRVTRVEERTNLVGKRIGD